MSALRTVDVAGGSEERAAEIARLAAGYILTGARREKCVQRDLEVARGIYDAEERRERIYVVTRAARLAWQHVSGGPQFGMILAELAAADTEGREEEVQS